MSRKAAPRYLSFHEYVRTRRYQFGRVSEAGWQFVTQALGDPDLPDAQTWPQLRDYLTRSGKELELIAAAQVVWNSYLALLAKKRRAQRDRSLSRRTFSDSSITWGAA